MAKTKAAAKGTEENPVVITAETTKPEFKKTREFLRHNFTEEEITQKGRKLAILSAEKISIENDKKAAMSNFKAKIDGKVAEIELLLNDINNGFGQVYVECEVRPHDPNTGMKSIYRLDTNELVRKESMSSDELQTELALFDAPVGDLAEKHEDVDDKDKPNS